MAEAVHVEAMAADNLVHFLITEDKGTSPRSSYRLTIPKCHLEVRPNSYLSALSSERWAATCSTADMGQDACGSGTASSPINLSVDSSPDAIRHIWGLHGPLSALASLIQRAYERMYEQRSAGAASDRPRIELPRGLEMHDAVIFLEYYGIFPEGEDAMDMICVPKDGPAATYLRSKIYPKEAKMIKMVRDVLVEYIANHPERATFFVFVSNGDDWGDIESSYYNSAEGGKLVALSFKSREGIRQKEGSLQETLTAVAWSPALRDKLVSHLKEDDKLEAEFIADQDFVAEAYDGIVPVGEKREQQNLIAVGTEQLDSDDEDNMPSEELNWFYDSDRRQLAWRFILKVEVPDA
mmetsp:Transcript_30690/g.66433  ORF Transcript_30690/g.66433 Transcript_30690/m.66433 type:complete len:352 (-) Transcript_30690:22-1077(-)